MVQDCYRMRWGSLAVLAAALLLAPAMAATGSPPEGWYSLLPGEDEPLAPSVVLVTEEAATTVVMIDILGMSLETVNEEGTDYSRISIPRYGCLSDSGLPELPVVPIVVAIPESDSIIVTLTVLDSVEITGVIPLPAPGYEIAYLEGGIPYLRSVFVVDESFYGRAEGGPYYPGSPVYGAGQGHLRAQAFSRVEIRPFQYEPASQVLKVLTRMRVTIEHAQSRGPRVCDVGPLTGVAAAALLGYDREPIPGARGGGGRSGNVTWCDDDNGCIDAAADYLIIYDDDEAICPTSADTLTHDGKKWLGRLANKRAIYDGFSVALLPVSGLPAPGDPLDDRIKGLITDLYESQTAANMGDGRLGFVLLVGDAYDDDQSAGIPMHNIPHFFGHAHGDHVSTDHWYACVVDTDGVADLTIGRLAPGDADELVTDTRKTVQYEPVDPSESWRSRAYLSCGFDSDQIGEHSGALTEIDSLAVILERHNYVASEQYCHLFPMPESAQRNAMRQANVDSFNLGRFLVVFHDHGWEVGHWTFMTQDTDSLLNYNMPSLVLSQACESGAVDNTLEDDDFDNTDSLAERLMHIDGTGQTGAIAFLGATESAYNKSLATYVVRMLLDSNRPMLGPAVDAAKAALFGILSWRKYGLVAHEFTLVGDPALDLLLSLDDGYTGLPDLVVRTDHVDVPRSGSYQDPIELRCEVTNESAVDIPTGALVELEFSVFDAEGQLHAVLRDTVDGLGSWSSWTATVTWDVGSEDVGNYDVAVMVDPDTTISEFREANNASTLMSPLSVSFERDGFPRALPDFHHAAALLVAELDQESEGDEILLYHHTGGSHTVEARDSDGIALWDFQHPGTGTAITPAVADMDGDGTQEVVVLLLGSADTMTDTCFVLDGREFPDPEEGRVLATVGVGTGCGSPMLGDIDPLDGHPEILIAADNGEGTCLSVWDVSSDPPDRRWCYPLGDFPENAMRRTATLANFTAAAGDVVMWTASMNPAQVICVGADGEENWTSDITGGYFDDPGYGSAAADLNGDGTLDIASVTLSVARLVVHSASDDGDLLGQSTPGEIGAGSNVAIGDLDGDGELDVVVAGHNRIDVFNYSSGVFSAPEWSKTLPAYIVEGTQPLIGDIDGGSDSEIVVATSDGGDHRLWILKATAGADTLELMTEPIWLPGKYATGAICDLNADGYAEIVFTTDDGTLHDLEYWDESSGRFDWPMHRHDPQRTGVHSHPMGGPLAESATWVGEINVHGDVIVGSDESLRLQPGTEVHFAPRYDSEGGGADLGLSEIIVDGYIEAVGGEGSAGITLLSDGSAGSWYGLRLRSGSACSLNQVTFLDAYKSVWAVDADPVRLERCFFLDQQMFGVQLLDCEGEAVIRDCGIVDCDIGIQCEGTQAELLSNSISEAHGYGIKLIADGGSIATGNSVAVRYEPGVGLTQPAGVHVASVTATAPDQLVLDGNTISIVDDCAIGMWLCQTTSQPVIVTSNMLTASIQASNTVGIKIARASVVARENELDGYRTAFDVVMKFPRLVDLGNNTGSDGLNCTDDRCVYNVHAVGWVQPSHVYAQNNWWGTAAPSPTRFYAHNTNVHWEPHLTEDPREGRGGDRELEGVREVYLNQNSPNPFNPTTTIAFGLPEAGPVTLRVYDLAGRLVRTLLAETADAGDHQVVWDGADDLGHPAASGVYFCRLKAGKVLLRAKLVLLK